MARLVRAARTRQATQANRKRRPMSRRVSLGVCRNGLRGSSLEDADLMNEREPSRTALAAAAHRAAHQLLEHGRIFADPLAVPILGQDVETLRRDAEAEPSRRGMRLFIAARSHFAEAVLKAGVEARGVRQLVVLGAGLDTYAYRNPLGDDLRVFEVDHPATQAWKRRRLAAAGIAIPASLTFAPVDFEREAFSAKLQQAGFDPARRSVFVWLGVAPYLRPETVGAALAALGALPGGAEVVFDYSDPAFTLPPELRAAHEARSARVAALGEPFLSSFEPDDLHATLRRAGFVHIDDLGPKRLFQRYFDPSSSQAGQDGVPDRGGHVVFAATA